MALAGLVFAGMGVFIMGSAILDWNYFMTHPKARPITALFGRNGARIIYALLGAVFVGLGLAAAVGLIGPPEGVPP